MMKWGKKKSFLPTSPRPSLISSWLLKFKKISSSSEAKPEKIKKKGKWNSPSVSSPQCASSGGGRFYGADDDAFWRLSFGEERVDGRKSGGNLRSVWYDSDDDLKTLPRSWQSCGGLNSTRVGEKEENWRFCDMVSDATKKGELRRDAEILPDMDACTRARDAGFRTPRRGTKEGKLRKNGRVLKKWSEFEAEKDELESTDSSLGIIEEDCAFAALKSDQTDEVSAEELRSAWQKLKEVKIQERKSKSEKQRRSLYFGRELQRRTKQGRKVRAYSPGTASKVEICKIKALEDMRKAKLKMKKKKKDKERVGEKRTGLDSFAVVKCSFDPQRDFRDSMMEMIVEKRISQAEELEELLACYLTLNSDEYHDLIIKVFRQVWYDLNQACFDTELQNENCWFE